VVREDHGRVPGASEVSESRLLNEPYGLLSSSSHIAPICSVCDKKVEKVKKDRRQLVAAMNVCLGKLRVAAPASTLRPTAGLSSAITYVICQALSTLFRHASRPSIALPCPSLLTTCSFSSLAPLYSMNGPMKKSRPCLQPSVIRCSLHDASVSGNPQSAQSGKSAAGCEAWRKVHRSKPTPCHG
jgi:hypothetical protein